jgi:hypothetical protein
MRTADLSTTHGIRQYLSIDLLQLLIIASMAGISSVEDMCGKLDAGNVLEVEQRLIPVPEIQVAVELDALVVWKERYICPQRAVC